MASAVFRLLPSLFFTSLRYILNNGLRTALGCLGFNGQCKKQKSIQVGLDCHFATTKYIIIRHCHLDLMSLLMKYATQQALCLSANTCNYSKSRSSPYLLIDRFPTRFATALHGSSTALRPPSHSTFLHNSLLEKVNDHARHSASRDACWRRSRSPIICYISYIRFKPAAVVIRGLPRGACSLVSR